MIRSLEKIRLYFTILGVLALIGLVVAAFGIITGIAGGLAGWGGAGY